MKYFIGITLLALAVGTYGYRIERSQDLGTHHFQSVVNPEKLMEFATQHCKNHSENGVINISKDVHDAMECALEVFNPKEAAEKFTGVMQTGDMEQLKTVFHDSCPKVDDIFVCAEKLKTHLPECLDAPDIEGIEALIRVIKRVAEYFCHNDGERVITMLTQGVPCIEEHKADIKGCYADVKEKFAQENPDNFDLAVTKEGCDMIDHHHHCVTDVVKKCELPAVYDVMNGLFLTIKKEVDCGKVQNAV